MIDNEQIMVRLETWLAISKSIDVLREKLKSRDSNIAHLDKLVDRLNEEIDELESHNRVLTAILTKVAKSIPADELSRRMYGFISDEEGNIREVTS